MNVYHLLLGLSGLMGVIFTPMSWDRPSLDPFVVPAVSSSTRTLMAENSSISVTGENGQYTGQVTINAPATTVWEVLTDYENFDNFFPNVANSQLIESQGDRKIFEQVYQIQIATIRKQFRVQLEATETYMQEIQFRQVEGDLNTLQGTWQMQTSPDTSQVLVTHQVQVVPVDTFTRGLFFSLYKRTFKDTLLALKQEAEQR